MSLLNDALKRAKLEALEREASEKDGYGLPTVAQPTRQRAWLPLLAGVVIGMVVLALVGAGIGWMLADLKQQPASHSPSETLEPAPMSPSATSDTAEGDGQPVESTDAEGQDRTGGKQDRASNQPVPASAARNQTTNSDLTPGRLSPVNPSQSPAATVQGDQPSSVELSEPAKSDPPIATLDDGASYSKTLQAGDQQLELQGIAFRRGTSVAIINGVMLSAEDMVGGFVVVAIEPDRVQLQGRGVTVYLSLH